MNDLNITFEESLWEQTLAQLNRGDSLSAVRFLTIMEQEEEEAVMDALLDLDAVGIALDPICPRLAAPVRRLSVSVGKKNWRSRAAIWAHWRKTILCGCIWKNWLLFLFAVIPRCWQWNALRAANVPGSVC